MKKRRYITNRAEAAFAGQLTRAGKLWFHQPKTFALPASHGSYRPDFYVAEDQCFYEVVGSRQAYSYAREKIAAFRAAYPGLRLEVINQGAWLNGIKGPRKPHVKRSVGGSNASSPRRKYNRLDTVALEGLKPEAVEILERCRVLGILRCVDLARQSALPSEAVWSALFLKATARSVLLQLKEALHAAV